MNQNELKDANPWVVRRDGLNKPKPEPKITKRDWERILSRLPAKRE